MASLPGLPKFQAFDGNGDPLVGGKLYTYAAGTTTPLVTYTDSTGATPNANPVVLDARGEASVWLAEGVAYKFTLKTAADVNIWTVDGVLGVQDADTVSQWVPASVSPTFASSTTFTVPGDETDDFHIGRRLKTTINAGTGYHTITGTSYNPGTGLTTVTVNGTSLDAGLSAASLGLLTATNQSIPAFVFGPATEVTMPLQPAFLAVNSVADPNVTGDATPYTIVCNSEIYDQSADYNNATGAFNAPVTGRYSFSFVVYLQGLTASHTTGHIELVTSNRAYRFGLRNIGASRDSANEATITGAMLYTDMDAGDSALLELRVSGGGTKVVTVAAAQTFFSGGLSA